MKVFTFFSEVAGKNLPEEAALIELWRKSWAARGWEPVILDARNLADTPETKRMMRHFRRVPSRNRKNLDFWCFARWLAVAQQGGGMMSDYDVINYSFEPCVAGALTTYDRWIPCLVSGTGEEFMRAVNWFLEIPVSMLDRFRQRHYSDMTVLQEHRSELVMRGECVEYALGGWETARTVHYSNRGMKPAGLMPRHAAIPALRVLDL